MKRCMNVKMIVALGLLMCCSATQALAIECGEACPDGQVQTSYVDGAGATCNCVDAAVDGMAANTITEADMTEADIPLEGQD